MNIDKYFKEEQDYYDSKILITILEDITNKTLEELMNNLNSSITLTEEDIKKYLDETFTLEDKELKERINKPKTNSIKKLGHLTKEEIKESSQEFIDSISAYRYTFEPLTLKYYKTYTNILRTKICQLLNIITSIATNNTTSIKDILLNLDIILDEKENISKTDIKRLIIPTIYNINDFNKKIEEGNKLDTYLAKKISRDSLGRDGILESYLYPIQELQIKDLYYDYLQGYIPLSINQQEKLMQEDEEFSTQILKMVLDLDD